MANKILIIEDTEENLRLFSSILKCFNYKTLEAKNGLEGVRLAKTENPDLILMDIQMPVMDGFDAIKILRSDPLTKEIPCIALTSYKMKDARKNFLILGFDDYIAKPIILKEFLRIIENNI